MPFPKFPTLPQNRTPTFSRGASWDPMITALSPPALLSLEQPMTQRTYGRYSHLFRHSPQWPAAPLSWLYSPYICKNRGKEHFPTFAVYFEKFKRSMTSNCHTPLFLFSVSVHTTSREEIWVLNIWNTLGRTDLMGKLFLPSPRPDQLFEGMNYFM